MVKPTEIEASNVVLRNLNEATVRAHWLDRDLDFNRPDKRGYLLTPQTTPNTKAAVKYQAGAARSRPWHWGAWPSSSKVTSTTSIRCIGLSTMP